MSRVGLHRGFLPETQNVKRVKNKNKGIPSFSRAVAKMMIIFGKMFALSISILSICEMFIHLFFVALPTNLLYQPDSAFGIFLFRDIDQNEFGSLELAMHSMLSILLDDQHMTSLEIANDADVMESITTRFFFFSFKAVKWLLPLMNIKLSLDTFTTSKPSDSGSDGE